MFGTKYIKRFFSAGMASNTAILMYHQIREASTDPWETAVRPAHFQQHLEVLRSDYQVYPLSDINKVRAHSDGKRKLAITFDDGYWDNYTVAVPLLRKYGFAATFYLPTQILTGEKYFWWEVMDYLFWDSAIAPEVWGPAVKAKYLPDADYISFKEKQLKVTRGWSANTMKPPTVFHRFYLEICAYIKNQPPDKQQAFARELAGFDPRTRAFLDRHFKKMSPVEVDQLFTEGFELGAHSVHHPALGMQDGTVQSDEINQSKAQLETLTGGQITTFAYPHGHYNETTRLIVRTAGFSSACTTAGGPVLPGTGLLDLPRIWVKDGDAAAFKKQLNRYFR